MPQIAPPITAALAAWKPLPRRAPRTRKKASSTIAEAQIATTTVAITICRFHSMAGAMSSAAAPRKCIAAKPAPTTSAPIHRRGQASLSRLATNSAMAEAATAAIQDSAVDPTPKPTGIGNVKASSPVKLAAHSPLPIASDPPTHQRVARCLLAPRRRWLASSAP